MYESIGTHIRTRWDGFSRFFSGMRGLEWLIRDETFLLRQKLPLFSLVGGDEGISLKEDKVQKSKVVFQAMFRV